MKSLFKSGLKGLSDSIFSGIAGSVFKCVGVDYRSKPGIITAHQKLTKNSATTIDELCKHAVAVSDGSNLWFSAVSGKIWREVGGVYTLIHTTAIADEPFDAPTQFPTLNGTNQKFTISDDDQTGLDFVVPTARVLLIAGGGGGNSGGANTPGGGGGAGGLIHNTAFTGISVGANAVVIGAGGLADNNGENSTFAGLTAVGGGAGGDAGSAGSTGGSGGGGGASGTDGNNPAGGAGTSGQGFAGGTGFGRGSPDGDRASGGGGGAGAVGENAVSAAGGSGGVGVSNDISGSAVFYAGGGGGRSKGGSHGAGGNGGGGSGGNTNKDGAANTGGGGGGGMDGAINAGSGGSGICIIRYATDGSDGISPSSEGGTKTTDGGDTIHTFTSSGTFTMVPSGQFSISAYINPKSFPTEGNDVTIIEKVNDTGDQRSWFFRITRGSGDSKLKLYAGVSEVGTAITSSRTQEISFLLKEWQHIGVTYDLVNDEVKFFHNGAQVGTTQTTLSANAKIFNSTAGVGIGGQADNNILFFDGDIVDVRVWHRIVSTAEMTSLYADPVGFNNGANLVAHWKLDNSLLDETANDNDLTNVGEIEFTEFGGTQPEMKTLGAEEHEGLVDEESANFIYWATEDRLWRIAVADIGTSWSLNGAFALFAKGDNTYHPMAKQNTSLFIGDKNVVASVSSGGIFTAETNFNLPINERILTLSPFDIDLIVGTEIGVKGRVLRWDTVSESWSTEDDVDNPVYAFIRDDNFVYASVGDYGQLYLFNGEKLLLVKQIQGSWSPTAKARVYHGSVSFWRNTPVFGLSNITGNPALQGVYGFGKHSNNYPATLSLDFPVSSGEFSGLEIGAIIVRGLDMWVAFKDGVGVGVDKVDWSNKYASSHIETTALSGAEDRVLLKTLLQATVPYFSLPANTAIAVGLKKAYEASFTALTMKTDTKRKLVYTKESNKDVIDPQLRIDLTVSGNNAPEFTDLLYDLTTPDTPK